jgi:hypothetical protein
LLWPWSANHPLWLPLRYEDPAPPTIPSLSFCLPPSPLHSSSCVSLHIWIPSRVFMGLFAATSSCAAGYLHHTTQPQLAYPVTCSSPMSLNCVFPGRLARAINPCSYSQAAHRESGWKIWTAEKHLSQPSCPSTTSNLKNCGVRIVTH